MTNEKEEGFVLPYVLVVIAILAIATTIAADRLQKSTNILAQIQAQSRIEQELMTAEAEAVYALLTGIATQGGIDLNPNSPVTSDLGFSISEDGGINLDEIEDGDINRDLWGGAGDKRISPQKGGLVIIELQDVSGLVSLSVGDDNNIISVLEALDISKNNARGLTAKLRDYSDADNRRQFKGAERADYRLRDKADPTNSPLRNYAELVNILSWEEVLEKIDIIRLKKMTTLQPVNTIKKEFLTPELADILEQEKQTSPSLTEAFDFAALEALDTTLSDISRLTFWVRGQTGVYRKRVIEIKRSANNFEKPFSRFWIYETTVLENDLNFDPGALNEIKNVIHAASVRLP